MTTCVIRRYSKCFEKCRAWRLSRQVQRTESTRFTCVALGNSMDARGFRPIAAESARLLILGSLPGLESLRHGEYYAHPRNSFWRVMEAIYNIPADHPYLDRTRKLMESGVALWDVCRSAHRPGSLDLAIRPDSVVVNDFAGFLSTHPGVQLIAFNGAKASAIFRKQVGPMEGIRLITLPSTSPAHAAVSFAKKVKAWSAIRDGEP